MKKIPTIFTRNPENMREISPEPHPDCQWVFDGEGIPTRKYDGTCVKIEGGKYFKRREVEKDKIPPLDFIEEQFDENTGKRVGWVEVEPSDPQNKYHMQGYEYTNEAFSEGLEQGTYELLGPKIQGNPEHIDTHLLIKHSATEKYEDVPRSFHALRDWLEDKDIEGIVFHHPDGRMAKIKKRDYGQKRV